MVWWILPLAILLVGAAALGQQVGAVRDEVAALRSTQDRLRTLRVALVRLRRARIAMSADRR